MTTRPVTRYTRMSWMSGRRVEWVGPGNYRHDIQKGVWVRCGDAHAAVVYIREGDLKPEGWTPWPEGSEE